MKIFTIIIALFFCFSSLMASNGYDVSYNQARDGVYQLSFDLDDYQLSKVTYDGVTYTKIGFEGRAVTIRKGYAEVPFLNAAVRLSPDKNVTLTVTGGEYIEYDLDHPLLPSRGNLLRNQDPATIPYEIDPASIVDEWYPHHKAKATDPYVIRDVRGTSVYVYPFRYNAEKQVLRVYKNMTVELAENDSQTVNPITRNSNKITREFEILYRNMFINYRDWPNEISDEYGEILVLYTSRDATVIQPWITWKKQMGFIVHEQEVSAGSNVVSTVQSAYDANNSLLYVQLVGDWADIQGGTDGGAPTDPLIGCVVGSDEYPELIVGRFSASSTSHVTVQGDKTITFERDPESGGAWYSKGLGIGSEQGAGNGDDGEADYVHMGYIKDRLLSFTYDEVAEAYGASPPVTDASGPINDGLTIVNYCGHGSHSSWATTGYSTSNVSSSTNGDKQGCAISVACVVGEFHTGSDCLAEAWVKKDGGGGVAFLGSTINQSWAPPMIGQDYMNDMIIGGYNYDTGDGSGTNTDEGRTRFGPITINGKILMANELGGPQADYRTWTLFGDASLQIRTDQPATPTVTNLNVSPGTYTTQVTVGASPFEGALVSLYQDGTDQPCAGLTDASGNVTITHSFGGTVKLTVTGFNLDTYQDDHAVQVPDPPVCDFEADQTTVIEGETVNFTDLSTNYPSEWAWTFDGGTPGTSDVKNPSIMYSTAGTYDVSLTVTNTAGTDSESKSGYITVTTNPDPPTADFEASVTTIQVGGTVDFTDLSTGFPTSWAWTFDGGTPGSSIDQNPQDVTYSAAGDFTVTLTATNANGSDTEEKTAYIHVSLEYPDGSGGCDEYISRVQIGTIDNSSQCDEYADYTSISTDVYPEQSYPITVTNGNHYSGDVMGGWVDWNIDGDWDDTGEEFTINYSDPDGTGDVVVPADATIGTTRMRLRLQYYGTPEPTGTTTYGEVEDYSLNVLPIPGITEPDNNDVFSLYPNPNEGLFYVTFNTTENVSLTVMNMSGQVVYIKDIASNEHTIDLSSQASGIYFVKVQTDDNIQVRKVVIH